MNILLPENSYRYYDTKTRNLLAEADGETLYLYSPSHFQKIMYDMTYVIYGHTCVYCGNNEAHTMDHRIPQEFGGPTITNNLYPSCANCNTEKANMLEEEFYEYISLNKQEKKMFRKNLIQTQEARRFGEIQTLPSEWIAEDPFRVLKVNFHVYEPLGSKYKRLLEFFNLHQRHKAAVTISGNGFLLDGFNSLILAKNKNRYDFDQIILENVIVK